MGGPSAVQKALPPTRRGEGVPPLTGNPAAVAVVGRGLALLTCEEETLEIEIIGKSVQI